MGETKNDFLPFDLVRFPTLIDPRSIVSASAFLLVFCQFLDFNYFISVFGLLFVGFETRGIKSDWSCGSTSEARVTWRIEVRTSLHLLEIPLFPSDCHHIPTHSSHGPL